MSSACDVLVAGGGPAGSVAALVLARAGFSVVLADASTGVLRAGEALPPAARPLLRDLELLSDVLADGHVPSLANASAWGSGDLEVFDFIFHPHGSGLHLDRARFDASLRAAAAAAGVRVITGARVGARRHVHLRARGSDEAVNCRWIVDATGRAATVATARGAVRTTQDALVAFHARFRPGHLFRPENGAADRDSRTLIESCPDGWWYTTLLPSRERVVALLTDKDVARHQKLLSPEDLMARIARTTHIRERLQSCGYTMAERPRGANAASSRLDVFHGDGWVAVGDAALTFDPLSSQGIFNAMYTGMQAGRALKHTLAGDAEALVRYADRVEEIHRAYRRNLAAFYALETRWREHPFWARRLTNRLSDWKPAARSTVLTRQAAGVLTATPARR